MKIIGSSQTEIYPNGILLGNTGVASNASQIKIISSSAAARLDLVYKGASSVTISSDTNSADVQLILGLAATTSTLREIEVTGTATDLDLTLTPKGSGHVAVRAGYETGVTADDLVTSQWVQDQGYGVGSIGGSISNTYVAFGTAANTIGGSANFIWDANRLRLIVPKYTTTSHNGLYLRKNGNESGDGVAGPGIVFGAPTPNLETSYDGAAIFSIQSGTDIDATGLAFDIRPASNLTPRIRGMTLRADGVANAEARLGIRTSTPGYTLDVNGNARIVDLAILNGGWQGNNMMQKQVTSINAAWSGGIVLLFSLDSAADHNSNYIAGTYYIRRSTTLLNALQINLNLNTNDINAVAGHMDSTSADSYTDYRLVTCIYSGTTYLALEFTGSWPREGSFFTGIVNSTGPAGALTTIDLALVTSVTAYTSSQITSSRDFRDSSIFKKVVIDGGASTQFLKADGTLDSSTYSTTLGIVESLTTTGTSGVATLTTGILNIPNYTYTLPEATATVRGGIELFSNTDNAIAANAVSDVDARTYGIQLNTAGQGVVNVPWSSGGTGTIDGTMVANRIPYGLDGNTLVTNAAFTVSGNDIVATGQFIATEGFEVNNTSNSNGAGIALYNGSSLKPQYGIYFGGTATFGTYGPVTGDWATYMTTNTTAGRGWIWKAGTAGQNGGNVFGISVTGAWESASNGTVNGTLAATTVTGANVTSGVDPGHTHSIYNNYSLPQATATVRGGVELWSDTDNPTAANAVSSTAARTYGVQLNTANQMVVNVPWIEGGGTGDVTAGTQANEQVAVWNATAKQIEGTSGLTYNGSLLSVGSVTASAIITAANYKMTNVPGDTTFSTSRILVRDTNGNFELLVAAGTSTGRFLKDDGTWAAAGGGTTDITITHAATTVTVNSSTGTNGVINGATISLAGVVTNGAQTWNGIKTFDDATTFVGGLTTSNKGIGIDVTSRVWGTYSALEVEAHGAVYGSSDSTTGEVGITYNAYYNTGWKYKQTTNLDQAARFVLQDGAFKWYSTSTAGKYNTAITFIEEMRLSLGGQLDVNGNVVSSSTVVSDARLKHKIEHISSKVALELLLGLDSVTYSYNYRRDGLIHTGYLAHEFEKYLPNAILKTDILGAPEIEGLYSTISYVEVIPYITEAMKEHNRLIKESQEEIVSLKKNYKVLRYEFNKYKKKWQA